MTRLTANKKRAGLMGAGHAAIIESITAYTKTLLVGASAAAWRTTLGLVIGTNVQAHDADLDAIAALTPSNDDFMQRKAGAWSNRSIAQVKTDLALAVELISSQTVPSDVAQVVFSNIPASGFCKFQLVMIDVVTDAAATTDSLFIDLSADNGSTFNTASGDYYANASAQTTLGNCGTAAGATSTFKHSNAAAELYGLGNASRMTSLMRLGHQVGEASTNITAAIMAAAASRSIAEADNAFRIRPNDGTVIKAGSKFVLMGFRE